MSSTVLWILYLWLLLRKLIYIQHKKNNWKGLVNFKSHVSNYSVFFSPLRSTWSLKTTNYCKKILIEFKKKKKEFLKWSMESFRKEMRTNLSLWTNMKKQKGYKIFCCSKTLSLQSKTTNNEISISHCLKCNSIFL